MMARPKQMVPSSIGSAFIMRCYILVVLLPALFMSEINLVESQNDKIPLSRRKRYVIFPQGASWSMAICTTFQAAITNNNAIWTEAINWGFSYYLPNDTSYYERFIHPHHVEQRRSRRELYSKMETILKSMGYDGRSCIFRALCETSQKFSTKAPSLLEQILKVVFKFPTQRIMAYEPEEHRLYHRAYRIGKDPQKDDCAEVFPECPFSLIDIFASGFTKF